MLKSGDRVKIREYLVGTTKEMRSFAGKMVTVDKAGDDTFSIMEDYGRGTWHVSMLQDASLVEGLVSTAYRNYEIPKDPAKLMYDFYFLTSYLDPKTLKLIDPETGEEIASLYDEELWSIKYLYSTIVNTLCSKLKMALKFSMSCEARHVFDRNTNLDHIDPKIAKFLAIFYRERGLDGNIDRYKDTQLFKNIPGYQTNRKIMNRADLSDESNLIGDSSEFKTSFVAFQRAQKECRLSDYEVGKIMEFCFEKLDWNSSYGGTPWADIARGFLMLNAADNGSDEKQLQLEDLSYLGPKIAAIDHAYDLQHNTGSAFNKLRTYASGGGYDWLLNNLDFKRFSIDVKDYYPIVSPALRPLVGWVSQRYHGESMEQYWDQYQVGERVVIKPNLHVSRKDHGAKKFGDYHLSVDSEMARYAGKVAVIMKVDDRKSGLKVFHLNVDQSNNSWTNDMFVKFSNKEERDDYLAKNPQPEEEVPVATGEETGFESAEVGDKVKVANLHGKDSVMGVAVTDTMMQLSGIKYVISEITTLDKIWGGSYPAIPAFKLRGWDYIWTTGMFVPGSLEKKNPPIASGEASASLAADLPMDISFNSQDEEITLFTFIQNKFPDILWKAGQKPLDYIIQGFPNGINISTNKQLTVSEDSETAIPYGTFIKKYSGGNGNTGKTQSSDYVTEMKERLNFPKANIAILITSRDEGNMTIPYVKKVFPTFQVWGTTPEEGFNNPDALAKLPYYFMIEAVGNSASYGYQDYVDQRSTKNYLKQYNYTTFTAEEFIEMSKEVEKKVSGAGGSLPSYDSLGLPKPWFIYFPSKESAKEGLKVMGNYQEITWVSGQNPDAFYPENPDADGPVCLGFGFSGGKPHLGWMKGDEYGKNYYKEKGGTEIHLADLLKGGETPEPKEPTTSHAIGESLVVKDSEDNEFVISEKGDLFIVGVVEDEKTYDKVSGILSKVMPKLTWGGGYDLLNHKPNEYPCWLYVYTDIPEGTTTYNKLKMYQSGSRSYVKKSLRGDRWENLIPPQNLVDAYTDASISAEAGSGEPKAEIKEGIVSSAYSHYSPPKDPAKLMYDFYFLTSYLNPETFHITDPKTGEEVGSVYDEELWSLKYMYYSITEHMYKHMKSALKYSIACEMRHLFDKDVGSYPEPIMRFLATFRRNLLIQNGVYDSGYSFLKHDPANIPKRRLMKRGILPQEDRAVSKYGDDSYRQCFLAMQRACKELGIDDLTYAQYTKKCFLENDWNGSYGGKNWANISAGLEMLIKADKGPITQSLYSPGALDFLNDKIVAIDHAYDLVHNTGSVFTKLKAYNKESGYRWIEKNLDFKRFSIDVRDYADVVSPELKPLVGWFSQLIGNGSIEQYDDLYSKGSIVVIKPNLQYSTKDRDRKIAGNYHLEVDDSMKMYAGKVAQITSMDTQPSGLRVFSLDIDHGANSWTNDMFVDMRNAENRETYQKVIDSYAEEVAAREAEEKVKAENRKERNLAIKLGAPQKNFVVLNVVTEDELSNVKKLVAKISGGSPVTWFTSVSIDEPPYEGFHLPADIYVNVSNLNSGVSEVMATADVGRYDSYKEMYPVAFSTEDIELMVGDKVKIEDHEPYTIGPVTKDNLDEVATKLEELYGSKVKWEYGGTPSETPSSVNKFLESDPLFLEMKYSGSVVYIRAMASKHIDPLYSVTDFLKGVLVETPLEEMGGVAPFSTKEETEGNPKLRVGDKVYISPKFGKEGKSYPFGVCDDMLKYAGKVATIVSASSSMSLSNDCYKYKINLDGGHWNWSWPMFAGIVSSDGPGPEGGKKEQKPEVAYEEGTTVTIRPDLSVMDKDMGIVVVAPMVELAGKKAHITNRTANTLEGNIYAKYLYKLDIDDGTYYWSYLMFTDDQNDRERDRRRDEDDDRRLPTGTKVKIKDDFTARGQPYDAYVDEEMECYAGKEATITDSDSTTPFYYSLDIDWGGNSWTSDMFDVVDGHIHGEEKKGGAGKPLPDGTKVHILDEFEKGKAYKAGLVRPDMTDLAGSDATITKSHRFSDHYSYSLDIDHGEHYWSTDMFTVTNSSDEDKATSPGTNVGTKDNPKHVYDVGDTVEIIPDLSTDMTEDVVGVDVLYSMLVFAGKKATITKVTKKLYESDTNGPYYTLDVDDGACYWTSDLFVHDDGPIDETPLKEGTEVTVNPDLTEAGGSKMGISVTKEMEKYAGKTGHITFSKENAHHPDVTKYLYELDLDNGYFYWTDKMFTVNG